MKTSSKDNKDNKTSKDDTLFGLLSAYKAYNTYFRILADKNNEFLIVQITSNPKKWQKINEETAKEYRLLKRSEIGVIKLSVKYLSPDLLIDQLGSILGIKLPESEVKVIDKDTEGVYSLELKSKYLQEIISTIEKIVELSPEKKYEFIEKHLSKEIPTISS